MLSPQQNCIQSYYHSIILMIKINTTILKGKQKKDDSLETKTLSIHTLKPSSASEAASLFVPSLPSINLFVPKQRTLTTSYLPIR